MRFRFIGQYTNGHTGINANGVDFVGREPAEVTDAAAIASLSRHPEFEVVPDEAAAPVEAASPLKRGRKPRTAK